jgi:ABC-type transport system substrate-binding protein
MSVTPTPKWTPCWTRPPQIIVDDQPWIPLFFGKTSILVKPHVKGYEAAPFAIPSLRYVSIER